MTKIYKIRMLHNTIENNSIILWISLLSILNFFWCFGYLKAQHKRDSSPFSNINWLLPIHHRSIKRKQHTKNNSMILWMFSRFKGLHFCDVLVPLKSSTNKIIPPFSNMNCLLSIDLRSIKRKKHKKTRP